MSETTGDAIVDTAIGGTLEAIRGLLVGMARRVVDLHAEVARLTRERDEARYEIVNQAFSGPVVLSEGEMNRLVDVVAFKCHGESARRKVNEVLDYLNRILAARPAPQPAEAATPAEPSEELVERCARALFVEQTGYDERFWRGEPDLDRMKRCKAARAALAEVTRLKAELEKRQPVVSRETVERCIDDAMSAFQAHPDVMFVDAMNNPDVKLSKAMEIVTRAVLTAAGLRVEGEPS